jgi:hypothetical protein
MRLRDKEPCDGDWQILYGLIGYEQLVLAKYGEAHHYNRIYLFGFITLFSKVTT